MMNLHRLGAFWTHQQPERGYTEPPKQLDRLEIQWVPAIHCTKRIREIRRTWYQNNHADLLESLDIIQWEARGGDQMYHPHPDVAVVTSANHVVGVLAGNPNHIYNYFFITEVAIHPAYLADPSLQTEIASKLLEAAIDFSQNMGFRGWVACHPEIHHFDLLRELGFYCHDDFTYRKMGYFS